MSNDMFELKFCANVCDKSVERKCPANYCTTEVQGIIKTNVTCPSDKSAAPGASAPAWKLAIVMGGAIVASQLFSCGDFAEGVKLHVHTHYPHIGIGCAGVIDVSKIVAVHRTIQSKAIPQFYHCQRGSTSSLYPAASLANRDNNAAH
jgi:hypothetical protein